MLFYNYIFIYRGLCLDELSKLPASNSLVHPNNFVNYIDADNNRFISSSKSIWKSGYQKVVPLGILDWYKLYSDPK
jgi:hypothetical protein